MTDVPFITFPVGKKLRGGQEESSPEHKPLQRFFPISTAIFHPASQNLLKKLRGLLIVLLIGIFMLLAMGWVFSSAT